jgi:GNAT superfamily N-acetyltransferase
MALEIVYRAATPADAFALAELSIIAGDGMFAFLLEEFAPQDMLAGLMAGSFRQDAGGSSWRQCYVAEEKGGSGVVGMINAFPAAWLRDEERDVLPHERVQVLEPIDQAQAWESFLVSGVAVRSTHRRQGIGKSLVHWAVEQARAGGFPQLSANVWADNAAAGALFAGEGFRVQTQVDVPAHPALLHVGGSLVVVRDLS